MTQENSTAQPNFIVRFFKWLWRFIVRLLFVLIIGVGVGAFAYFIGVPTLFREPFQKIEDTSSLVKAQATAQANSNTQVSDRLSALQDRIVNLEVFRDTTNESGNLLEDQLTDISNAQATQQAADAETFAAMQTSLDDIAANLDALDQAILALEAEIASVQATADAQTTALETALGEQQDSLAAVQEAIDTRGTPLETLYRELQVVRTMELITRAGLFISQANYGLAEIEVATAEGIITALRSTAPETQTATLDQIITRLQSVSEALPEDPTLASDNLEAAWQILTRELSNTPEELLGVSEPEATPEGTPSPTGTATPTEDVPTPTPTATPTP